MDAHSNWNPAADNDYTPEDPISVPCPGERTPELLHVLVFRRQDWSDFLLIPRRDLHEERVVHDVGSGSDDHISIYVRLDETTVHSCINGGQDWSRFRANWSVLTGSSSRLRNY